MQKVPFGYWPDRDFLYDNIEISKGEAGRPASLYKRPFFGALDQQYRKNTGCFTSLLQIRTRFSFISPVTE
jgi:hypothetical protein